MADTNVNYQGYVEQVDLHGLGRYLNPLWLYNGHDPNQDEINEFLADNPDQLALYNSVAEFNKLSVSTVAAVKVPYTGTTAAERIAWINERLTAIAQRAIFVKRRVDATVDDLKADGVSSAGTVFLGIWSTAFTVAVPVVGGLISGLALGKISKDKAASQVDKQNLILTYQADIQQLAKIQAALKAELDEKPYEAPKVDYTWWIVGGIGLLLLLFFIYRKYRKKRRKRWGYGRI